MASGRFLKDTGKPSYACGCSFPFASKAFRNAHLAEVVSPLISSSAKAPLTKMYSSAPSDVPTTSYSHLYLLQTLSRMRGNRKLANAVWSLRRFAW